MTLNGSVSDLVRSAVEAHGLTARQEENVVHVDGGRLALEGYVFDKSKAAGSTALLELVASAPLLGDHRIIECFAGVGASYEHAKQDAFKKMLMGTLHVLIEALTEHACDDEQVDVEQWRGDAASWKVFLGPLLTQQSSASTLTGPYSALLPELQDLFLRTAPPGPHWVRIFVGAYGGKVQASEVLLDNEPWDAALSLLEAQPWQCHDEYQSIRHFMLMIPTATPGALSAPPDRRSTGLKDLLTKALRLERRT